MAYGWEHLLAPFGLAYRHRPDHTPDQGDKRMGSLNLAFAMSGPNAIPSFIKRRAFDSLMFGWVEGVRYNLPSVSVESAVRQFLDYHQIDEEEYKLSAGIKAYGRMKAELRDFDRSGL